MFCNVESYPCQQAGKVDCCIMFCNVESYPCQQAVDCCPIPAAASAAAAAAAAALASALYCGLSATISSATVSGASRKSARRKSLPVGACCAGGATTSGGTGTSAVGNGQETPAVQLGAGLVIVNLVLSSSNPNLAGSNSNSGSMYRCEWCHVFGGDFTSTVFKGEL